MLRSSKVAKPVFGVAMALILAVAGLAQPVGQKAAPQVPEKLPELVKAIAEELEALEATLKEMPALAEALKGPMALAHEALESVKDMEELQEGALKDLMVLSLALHRIEEVFAQIQAHMPAGMGPGRKGTPAERGPRAGLERFGEVRDWIEAYLKGAMSALSPEEAAKFRGIVEDLVRGLREEFVPRGPRAERPAGKAWELGKHVLRLKALGTRLDLLLVRALRAEEAPEG